jgi:hypothetical protein
MKFAALAIISCVSAVVLGQETTPLTPKLLQTALASRPEGAEAEKLADRIRAYFAGSEALLKGGAPKIDELTVAWALESPQVAPNVTPRVVADVGALNLPMVRVGTSGVFAGQSVTRRGDDLALRSRTGSASRGLAAGSLRDTSRQP